MNRIKELSESVKRKIAAGEVVEGPFSVVKELLENSIDSGADEIDVTVFESGLKKIMVRDNGCGILRDDAALAVAEHATSKISEIDDIEKILTYGFRGEALSSISAISDLTMLTRASSEETGSRLESRSGSVRVSEYAGSTGTTVIVENLFYNTPARKKFLKSQQHELKSIREIFLKTATVNFRVSFSFESEGKRQLTLPGCANHEERLRQIYGSDVSGSLYFESIQDISVRLTGFFSKPDFLKSSRNLQQLFVNGRPVEYKNLGFHLSRAYDAVALHGKYPAAFIFMEISPDLIDPNIHPAKREIKFFDQKYIDGLIYSIASKALNRSHEIKGSSLTGADYFPSKSSLKEERDYNDLTSLFAEETIESGLSRIEDKSASYMSKPEPFKITGSVFNKYIIFETDSGLGFIDFHAAHERIIFDSISARADKPDTQSLAIPEIIGLGAGDFYLVTENIDIFASAGFELDALSGTDIAVRAVPVLRGGVDPRDYFVELFDSIKSDGRQASDIRFNILASLACHSAKRGGDVLSLEEMKIIVEKVLSGVYELRCPHGRPFLFRLEKNELERLFKRQ